MDRPRVKVWARRVGLLALVALACQQTWRHGQDYVFADKFAVVEPGRLYRGAWQHDWPMRRIVRDRQIKTIVALAHPPTAPLAVQESKLADELGVRWVHVPIVEEFVAGERKDVGDALERAADVLADPAAQPVYFHCHHGLNRASMVQMAYRMKHCGWSLERATAEIAGSIGLVKVSKGVDYRYMDTFYRERILPRVQARVSGSTTR